MLMAMAKDVRQGQAGPDKAGQDKAGQDEAGQDEAFDTFLVDRPGRIVLVGHHLSTQEGFRCLIRSISLFGATLDVDPKLPVPNNFFLEILGIRDEIGCTVMRRDADTVEIAFNMLLDPEFLHHVLRLSFEIGQ